MLRQQKGPVKSCLEQLQSISQSIAFGKKKKILFIFVFGKAQVRRKWTMIILIQDFEVLYHEQVKHTDLWQEKWSRKMQSCFSKLMQQMRSTNNTQISRLHLCVLPFFHFKNLNLFCTPTRFSTQTYVLILGCTDSLFSWCGISPIISSSVHIQYKRI